MWLYIIALRTLSRDGSEHHFWSIRKGGYLKKIIIFVYDILIFLYTKLILLCWNCFSWLLILHFETPCKILQCEKVVQVCWIGNYYVPWAAPLSKSGLLCCPENKYKWHIFVSVKLSFVQEPWDLCVLTFMIHWPAYQAIPVLSRCLQYPAPFRIGNICTIVSECKAASDEGVSFIVVQAAF